MESEDFNVIFVLNPLFHNKQLNNQHNNSNELFSLLSYVYYILQ